MTTVNRIAEAMKVQIIEDAVSCAIPHSICSFSELHDFVDANEYGGLCSPDSEFYLDKLCNGDFNEAIKLVNEAQNIVSDWLARGELENAYNLAVNDKHLEPESQNAPKS